MKKIVKISLILGVIILLTGCNNKENKKEEKKVEVNTNEEVIKDQTLDVFKFTNTSLIYQDGTSTLETTVTNTTSEKQYLAEFKIHVKDKTGNEIVELTGFVGDNIEGNGTKVITSSYGEDLTKATSIEYEIVK